MDNIDKITNSDALTFVKSLPDESVHCIVTSPPYYGLRDYGVNGQIGLEETPEKYIKRLVDIFGEARRVLKDDGTMWINLGDSYARSAGNDSTKSTDSGMQTGRTGKSGQLFKNCNNRPPTGMAAKNLLMMPARVALALQAEGWILRSDIIWHKPNPMPESVKDRPTNSHEHVFLLVKSQKYFYDADAIRERGSDNSHGGGIVDYSRKTSMGIEGRNAGLLNAKASATRNKRSVWTIPTQPFSQAHFAVFPPTLIEPMIKAGCPVGGIVLDPFMGAGTTGLVAKRLGRHYIGSELNPEYVKMAQQRIDNEDPQKSKVLNTGEIQLSLLAGK